MTLKSRQFETRYQNLEYIASGGMGDVYSAFDTTLGRRVAIKRLPAEYLNDNRRRERLEREARVGARLQHANIVDVLDFVETQDQQWVVMELLEGCDLRTMLKADPLHWRKAIDFGLQVLNGLQAAHREGFVHRDLKPSNIFVCSDGTVKILDFGLARVFVDSSFAGAEATLTEEGTTVGTPAYMAPEQVRAEPCDARVDVFSFGCILYEMLTGRRAFARDSPAETMAAVLRDEPDALDVPVPQAMHDVLSRCLEKEASRRFTEVAELKAALEAMRSSGDADVVSGTPSQTKGVFSLGQRGIPRWLTLSVISVLVVTVVIVWWFQTGTSRPSDVVLAKNRLVVAPFSNLTGVDGHDGLADLTTQRLIQGLSELGELEVVTAAMTQDPNGSAQELAEQSGAGLVLSGSWSQFEGQLQLRAKLEDANSRAIVRSIEVVPGSQETPTEAIPVLRDRALIIVQDFLHPLYEWGAGDRFPDYEAYRANRRAWDEWAAVGVKKAFSHMVRAVELDPDFARPRIQAGGAWIPWIAREYRDLVGNFYEPVHELELSARQQRLVAMIDAKRKGRWEECYRIAFDEVFVYSGTDRDREMLVRSAYFANHPDEAIRAFESIDRTWFLQTAKTTLTANCVTSALHLEARHEDELSLARELLNERPVSTFGESIRVPELRALAALGRMSEIEDILETIRLEHKDFPFCYELYVVAEELLAHGWGDQARDLIEKALVWTTETPDCLDFWAGYFLKMSGRLEEALQVFGGLLQADPENRDLIAQAGICAARLGDVEKAMVMDERLTALGEERCAYGIPYHGGYGFMAVRRAQIACALGDSERALDFLRQAVSEGFNRYYQLHRDSDLAELWEHPDFKRLIWPHEARQ